MTPAPRRTTTAVNTSGKPERVLEPRLRPEICPTPSRVPLDGVTAKGRAAAFSEAIKAYRCPCGGWHVGKVDASLQRKLDRLGGAE